MMVAAEQAPLLPELQLVVAETLLLPAELLPLKCPALCLALLPTRRSCYRWPYCRSWGCRR